MRRTQLYLDEGLWKTLRTRARREKTTVSELVRKAVRKQYAEDPQARYAAMMSIVGLWKDRTDLPDTEAYVRNLRHDTRLQRLGMK